MARPLVSVIVPVHNSVDTLGQCVRSLLSQTYERLQIVLVENGSQDESYQMCLRLGRQSSKVAVYSTGEADVMHARNLGIEESKGSFVAFCDADDWYRPHAIERLVEKAQEHDVCIVKAGYDKVVAPGIPVEMHRSFVSRDTVVRRDEWRYEDYARFYNPHRYPFSSSLWASLYERGLVLAAPLEARNNGLRRGEDMLLNAFLYESAETIVDIPDRLYCYRLGGVTSSNERLIDDLFLYRDKLNRIFADKVPVSGEKLNAEFDSYLLAIALKRYQNCSFLTKRDMVEFYQTLVDDERVSRVAHRVLARLGSGDDLVDSIARLLNDCDAAGLFELAKSTYGKRRIVLKTGNKASKLLVRVMKGYVE
ncbi:glycosyltransferase family 2 protein [Gordonibacter massiliensis (ex Traore et al. 2017)]|uniref:glycosyltransferase family 2 protein n=1 Tax=Gordonibacter massiliensis (ex Traore et al. 2017) TaxID=1841863 RepID=UPI001C8B2F4B|nr:glycosyltransferase family 2 protein [Gordonibacter massiliensis (ex Traore et al. 2017)]MBX9033740.1 glycosyltransferase family 2 protein [Gordonibacter massiliensis (ex Traore et al. 2017)]